MPAWLRAHGLEREQAEAMLAAIPAALAGTQLTREELAAAVAERVGEPDLAAKLKGGFGDLLKPAAFTGDLCFAPGDGARVRFARPADLLGGWDPVDPEGEEAVEVDVDGRRGWMLAADVDAVAAAEPAGVVRLLGGFDHYVVAAPRDADAVLAAASCRWPGPRARR